MVNTDSVQCHLLPWALGCNFLEMNHPMGLGVNAFSNGEWGTSESINFAISPEILSNAFAPFIGCIIVFLFSCCEFGTKINWVHLLFARGSSFSVS